MWENKNREYRLLSTKDCPVNHFEKLTLSYKHKDGNRFVREFLLKSYIDDHSGHKPNGD
jgi:hypothetical protein